MVGLLTCKVSYILGYLSPKLLFNNTFSHVDNDGSVIKVAWGFAQPMHEEHVGEVKLLEL